MHRVWVFRASLRDCDTMYEAFEFDDMYIWEDVSVS